MSGWGVSLLSMEMWRFRRDGGPLISPGLHIIFTPTMQKNLVILALVFGVLLAAFLVYNRNLNDLGVKPKSEFLLTALKQDEVTAFQINNFTEGYYFKKVDTGWSVKRVETPLVQKIRTEDSAALVPPTTPEQQADAMAVSRLLTHLFLLEVTEPIATGSGAVAKFQINEHSPHVVFFDAQGKTLARIFVGKQGPDFMSSFVRRGDENAIYLVEKNLHTLMLLPFEDWLFKEKPKTSDENTPQKKD